MVRFQTSPSPNLLITAEVKSETIRNERKIKIKKTRKKRTEEGLGPNDHVGLVPTGRNTGNSKLTDALPGQPALTLRTSCILHS